MIESKFKTLRFEKSAREQRVISLREIARETGLSLGTIQKLAAGSVKGARVETLDALCIYFNIAHIGELIEFKK